MVALAERPTEVASASPVGAALDVRAIDHGFVLHDELQKIKGIERTETFISLDENFNRNVQVFKG